MKYEKFDSYPDRMLWMWSFWCCSKFFARNTACGHRLIVLICWKSFYSLRIDWTNVNWMCYAFNQNAATVLHYAPYRILYWCEYERGCTLMRARIVVHVLYAVRLWKRIASYTRLRQYVSNDTHAIQCVTIHLKDMLLLFSVFGIVVMLLSTGRHSTW